MHGQLLLQVPDLLLKTLDLQVRVHHGVDSGFIRDFHHTRGKLECRGRLRQVASLRPDVSDHDRLAVTANRVAQEVGQFGLPVGDVATLFVRESENDLFEETERLVDEAGFLEDEARGARLLRHLTSSQVDEVQF